MDKLSYIAHFRLPSGQIDEVPYMAETDAEAIAGVKEMIADGLTEGEFFGIVEVRGVFDKPTRVVYRQDENPA